MSAILCSRRLLTTHAVFAIYVTGTSNLINALVGKMMASRPPGVTHAGGSFSAGFGVAMYEYRDAPSIDHYSWWDMPLEQDRLRRFGRVHAGWLRSMKSAQTCTENVQQVRLHQS